MNYSIEGRTYHYNVQGAGPSVLLLHGFTGSKQTWQLLKSSLVDKFQVITIDLPGHGNTTSQVETMEQCCHDLARFLNYLQITQTHIVGYSMGGRVALSFAMFYPQFVASLTLESSSAGLQSLTERNERIASDEQLARKIEQEGITSFVEFWESIPLFDTQKHLPKQVQHTIRQERLNHQAEGLAQSLRSIGTGRQPSWWKKLSTLKVPVLLVAGELDHKFININEQMKNKLQNAKLSIIEKAGHAIHVEQPEKFGKLVVSFLRKHIAK